MTIDEIKSAVKTLSPAERRKVALYILELEKDYVAGKVGPQVSEDVDAVGKLIQGAIEKLKNVMKDSR